MIGRVDVLLIVVWQLLLVFNIQQLMPIFLNYMPDVMCTGNRTGVDYCYQVRLIHSDQMVSLSGAPKMPVVQRQIVRCRGGLLPWRCQSNSKEMKRIFLSGKLHAVVQ